MRRLSASLVFIGGIAVSACAPEQSDPPRTETSALISNRNLDLLFMVDNSSSMRLSQTNLLNNFPSFMTTLQSSAQGLPNIHVAVVSSDMGAGDGSIAGCDATGGDNGVFQYTARGTCINTNLQPNATFISNIGGQANYTGQLADVFTCIAALGETGCGFEHQFASVLRALGADGAAAPAENQGFLRSDALLAIIMVTNEDDCSARPGVMLYDTSSNRDIASTLGPPSNYRCNEFGHLCNGVRPPRLAPNNDVNQTVSEQICSSSECAGSLTPVAEFVSRIKALKSHPDSEVLVAAIAGPPVPYTVHWKTPSTQDTSCGAASCPWPEITHSCMATDGSFADPAVRITEMIGAFGANGFVGSICDSTFSSSLQQIGDRINALLSAGGGTGAAPGPITTCPTGAGGAGNTGGPGTGNTGGPGTGGSSAGGTSGGMAGAGGSGAGGRGSGGRGGTSGGGAATGTGATTGMGGGGWCQIGGAGASAWSLAFTLIALIGLARRRRATAAGRSSRR